ncbi:MAG TPA: arginine--tRNA ligase, partial [Salinimicrobium sp.]|nr:arginine--tRNA ligase [Salinimicrobium sp.]
MSIQKIIAAQAKQAVKEIYGQEVENIEFQPTRKDFEGDLTLVVFPMLRQVKTNPAKLGTEIGNFLIANNPQVEKFNVVQGFVNIVLKDEYFLDFFGKAKNDPNFGKTAPGEEAIMVEYSSPNTNKPLHLGHLRNILLGFSVSEILKAAGKIVYKTQIINDRGIHICKSMLAWKRYGNGETPESSGLKGDQLVGKYYVKFDQVYKEEISQLISEGKSEEEAKAQAPVLLDAQKMLLLWEAGDEETVALWKKMNHWVYEGFEETYRKMGVDFDKNYYESDTYLLGKSVVAQGIEKGVFYRKQDGSVWIDLTE